MADSLSPQSWFTIGEAEADSILGQNGTWPFRNISKPEFFELMKNKDDYDFPELILRIYGSLTCALGIIFSVLLIGTLWKKAVGQKNKFYIAMLLIGITDLIFNLSDLLVNSWYRTYEISGSSNPVAMWVMVAVRCIAYTSSLVSDMLAIALTFDRYLAVSKPQMHKTLMEDYRSIIHLVTAGMITVISATRLHYAVDRGVEWNGSHYIYSGSEIGSTPFVVTLTMISDMILPFVLLILMLLLSSLFRFAVTRRQKKKKLEKAMATQRTVASAVHPQNGAHTEAGPPQSQSTSRKSQDSNSERSIVALTLALDALFIINQLGYCSYCVVEFIEARYVLSFDSSPQDIAFWVLIYQLENYTTIASTLAECVSHALNFPLYMALSGSMRKDFVGFWKSVLGLVSKEG